MDYTIASNDRFVRRGEVLAIAGISRTQLYQQMAEGRFPRNIRLGSRSVAWLESEIIEWMRGKVDATDRRNHNKPPATK